MIRRILDDAGVAKQVRDPQSAGAGAVTSAAIDLTGYDRVLYVLNSGTNAATGTLDVKIQDATATGGVYADITSAAFVQVTTANHNAIYLLDCPVVSGRSFHKVVQTVALAACIWGVTAIPYSGTRVMPATQSASPVIV